MSKEPRSRKLAFALLGLALLLMFTAVILIYDRVSWGTPGSTAELGLIGTWVDTQGNSLHFKVDGSAIGHQEGYADKGIYRWRIKNGVLSIEICPVSPGPKWFARKFIDDFMNANRCDDYEIEQEEDSLILEELQSGRVLEFQRSNDMAD
ncbi:MAG: hypothetical protein GXP24_07315 [Planctomycetes bacterium]|nr:hypothetical protein [Planctomycetota bacterium]